MVLDIFSSSKGVISANNISIGSEVGHIVVNWVWLWHFLLGGDNPLVLEVSLSLSEVRLGGGDISVPVIEFNDGHPGQITDSASDHRITSGI